MPIYDSTSVEYGITSGHIQIAMEDGRQLPAYWAHPNIGRFFPAVALIHDWWGITPIIRRIANHFAQAGYYVIVPDLFAGRVAQTPAEAMELVKALGDGGYPLVDAALTALESHHNTNRDVAAVGVGMGGSLAYEAAIVRHDLEAAVSYYGFPQRYLGRFPQADTPILAIYGDQEPYILPPVRKRLQTELSTSQHGVHHELVVLAGAGHDFFSSSANETEQAVGRKALNLTFPFLEKYLTGPVRAVPKTM